MHVTLKLPLSTSYKQLAILALWRLMQTVWARQSLPETYGAACMAVKVNSVKHRS